MTITVSNSQQLQNVLSSLQGGETILLERSVENYSVSFQNFRLASPDTPVTIKSADTDNPAVFDTIFLRNVSNVVIDDVVVHSAGEADRPSWHVDVNVYSSQNVTIKNSEFSGIGEQYASNFDEFTYSGLKIRNVDGFKFEGNDVSQYGQAMALGNVSNADISDNHFHHIQGDNIRSYELQNVTIENNMFSDSYGAASNVTHTDYIQLWSTRTTEQTHDLTIKGNTFLSSDYSPQSIFIRNEAAEIPGNEHLRYENFVIEDNVIYNSHYHGISVSRVDGITIQNNTLVDDPVSNIAYMAPSINVKNSTGVVVQNNVASDFNIDSEALVNENNIQIQNVYQNSDNYIGNVFLNALDDQDISLEDLKVNPNGILVKDDGSVYGSQRLALDASVEDLEALIVKLPLDDGSPYGFKFDASFTANENGKLTEQDATFVWDFGDGTTGEGILVSHVYETPGSYNTTLTVTDSDGNTSSISTVSNIDNQEIFNLEISQDGLVDISEHNSELKIRDVLETERIENTDHYAYVLTDQSGFNISRNSSQIYNHDQLTFEMIIKSDSEDSAGSLLYLHSSLRMDVNDSGELTFSFTNADGQGYAMESTGANLLDTQWHHVVFTYNSHSGDAQFYVDGAVVGEASFEGVTQAREYWGLDLGHPWGNSFDGLIGGLEIRGEFLDQGDVTSHYNDFLVNILGEDVVVEEDVGPDVVEEPNDDVENDNGEDSSNNENPYENHILINGDDDDNTIRASNDHEFVDAGAGDDDIKTYGGDDVVYGGAGNDRIGTYAGDDIVDGGDGDDSIGGLYGNDILYGGNGNDYVEGHDGDDIVLGGNGDDKVVGNGGNDYVDGGDGVDIVHGGGGDDVVVLDINDSSIRGGSGDGYDTLLWQEATGTTELDMALLNMWGFEAIDMDNGEANTLTIGRWRDILQSDNDTLVIEGGADDVLDLNINLQPTGVVQMNGQSYQSFGSEDHSYLLVDTDVNII